MLEEQDQPKHRSSIGEVFQRVHKVETEVASVRTDLASIAQIVKAQDVTLTRIATGLEQRQQTDWKALASWATVILAVGGLFASLTLAPIRADIQSIESTVNQTLEKRVADAARTVESAEEVGRYKERVDMLMREAERRASSQ